MKQMKQERTYGYSDLLIANRHFTDLNPRVAGEEVCAPGHHFGPAVRRYALLHCVLSGQGVYTCGGVSYPVRAGEIFRILPGEETVYRADREDPWHYCWIGFDGALSEKMAEMPPVFPSTPSLTRLFLLTAENAGASEYSLTASLFRLYDELFGGKETGGNEYVRRVRNYIDAMYMKKIGIEDLAATLHVNRRYLTRLFHAEVGMSIREYLLRTRMREAAECLLAGNSVGESAERCGYEDMFLFSKLFKKVYGVSPSAWKAKRQKADAADPPPH